MTVEDSNPLRCSSSSVTAAMQGSPTCLSTSASICTRFGNVDAVDDQKRNEELEDVVVFMKSDVGDET